MGEVKKNIFKIGSPDVDVILSKQLPKISSVKKKYDINFDNYAICIFHPVTTEINKIRKQIKLLCRCLIKSKFNYVLLYPNNDLGSNIIISELLKLKESINDEIEKKRTQQTLSSANRKGLSLVWIAVAIAIAAFRYFSS